MTLRVALPAWCLSATFLITSAAQAQAAPPTTPTTAPDHIPPDPPQDTMGDMSYKDMVSMMQMGRHTSFRQGHARSVRMA